MRSNLAGSNGDTLQRVLRVVPESANEHRLAVRLPRQKRCPCTARQLARRVRTIEWKQPHVVAVGSYSQRSWFMVYDGRVHLLLPSAFGDALLRRIEEDPRVRLRVGRKLYDQRALPVTAEVDLGALLAPLIRRQFAMEISGRVTRVRREVDEAEIRIYRLEDR